LSIGQRPLKRRANSLQKKVRDISQILYQIAITAGVAVLLF
jgi:hypothetical protein